MSAWLVSKKHIDILVWGVVNYLSHRDVAGVTPKKRIDAVNRWESDVGRLLWRENMRSLAARYNDPIDEAALAAYEYEDPAFHRMAKSKAAMLISKAAHCFDYQACEHDDYNSSEAAALMKDLVWCAVMNLPGYDDAPWGIDEARLTKVGVR